MYFSCILLLTFDAANIYLNRFTRMNEEIRVGNNKQTYKPASNVGPFHLIGSPSIGELLTAGNISCIIKCYIMKADQCTIFASKDVSLYKICTFFNSPLQQDCLMKSVNIIFSNGEKSHD